MTDCVAQMAGQMCAFYENLILILSLMHLGNKCVGGDGDHALSFSAPQPLTYIVMSPLILVGFKSGVLSAPGNQQQTVLTEFP